MRATGDAVRIAAARAEVAHATRAARLARIAAADDLRARARLRTRMFWRVLGLAGVLLIVLIVSLPVLAVLDHTRTARLRAEDEALSAARAAVTTMLAQTPSDATGYVERVLAISTGPQYARVARERTAIRDQVAARPRPVRGQVIAAGVVSPPSDDASAAKAQVLVVATTSAPGLLGVDPSAQRLTLRLGMSRVGGGWKVATVVAL
ncbi:MAG: hypothetical protein QM673_17060 [Gordonia sp. (in: high G+C Gram-positive bacteria)]